MRKYAIALLLAAATASAEPSPSSGTIHPGDPVSSARPIDASMTWTGSLTGVNQGGHVGQEIACAEDVDCQTFLLTLRAGKYAGTDLTIEIRTGSGIGQGMVGSTSDYDLYVRDGSSTGPLIGASYWSGRYSGEILTIPLGDQPQDRVFAIRVVGSVVAPGNAYTGVAYLSRGFLDCTVIPGGGTTDLHLDQGDPYAPEKGPLVEVPVAVHVLTSETGVGDLSRERIETQIEAMNQMFSGERNPDPDRRVDTRLRFRLAEITRTANDNWFQDLPDPIEGNYWDVLARDPHRVLNIYTNAFPVLGYGYYPSAGGTGSSADRTVILYSTFGNPAEFPQHDTGEQTVHEIGHYFGLLHVVHEARFVDQSQCDTQSALDCFRTGDLICDTAPTAAMNAQCDLPDSCALDGAPDPIHNFMNYGPEECSGEYNLYEFTPQQARRMRCALEHYRPLLGSDDNCPNVLNLDQLDRGGVATSTPDGIGDACQCGDVTGNGIVDGQDANAIKRHSLGLEPNPLFAVPGNCDVTGNGECNGQDANAVTRAALGQPSPSFGQHCHNATGAPLPPEL